jgi:hypothetical protein
MKKDKAIIIPNRIITTKKLAEILKKNNIKKRTFKFVFQFVKCPEKKKYCEGCIEDTLAIIRTVREDLDLEQTLTNFVGAYALLSNQKEKISQKQVRGYLFGWLWVEKNIMKKVREKLKRGEA